MKTLVVLVVAILAISTALKAKSEAKRHGHKQKQFKPQVEGSDDVEHEVKTLKQRVEKLEKGTSSGGNKMDDKTVIYLKRSIEKLEKHMKKMEKKAKKEVKKHDKDEDMIIKYVTDHEKDIKKLDKRMSKMEKHVEKKGGELVKGVTYLKQEVKKLQMKVDKLEGGRKKGAATVYYQRPMHRKPAYQKIPATAAVTQSPNATNATTNVIVVKPWDFLGKVFSHLRGRHSEHEAAVNATNNGTQSTGVTSSPVVKSQNNGMSWWERKQARRQKIQQLRENAMAAQVNATANVTGPRSDVLGRGQYSRPRTGTQASTSNYYGRDWMGGRPARRNQRKQMWGVNKDFVKQNMKPGVKTYNYNPTAQTLMGGRKGFGNRRQQYQKVYSYGQTTQQQNQNGVRKDNVYVNQKPLYQKPSVYGQRVQRGVMKPMYKKMYTYTQPAQQAQLTKKVKETENFLDMAMEKGGAAAKDWINKNHENIDVAAIEKNLESMDIAPVVKDVISAVSATVNVDSDQEMELKGVAPADKVKAGDDDDDNDDDDDDDEDDDGNFFGNIYSKVKNFF